MCSVGKNQNAPFNIYHTERGGEVTYHGHGQVFPLNYLLTVWKFPVLILF